MRVFIEMPLGNRSQPHVGLSEDEAMELFARFASQMRPWREFAADVVLTDDDGKEVHRERIANA